MQQVIKQITGTKPLTGGTNAASAATEQSVNGVSKAANAASDQTNNSVTKPSTGGINAASKAIKNSTNDISIALRKQVFTLQTLRMQQVIKQITVLLNHQRVAPMQLLKLLEIQLTIYQ